MAEAMPAMGRELRLPWQKAARQLLWNRPVPSDPGTMEMVPFDRARAVAEARQYVKDRGAELERFSYADPHVARKAAAALRRMLAAIEASGSKMIIVVPPVTRPLREEMAGQEWDDRAGFSETLRRLETEGAVVSNYFHGSPKIAEFGHFRDNHHLNARGSAAFSRLLGQDLRAQGILPPAKCEVRLSGQG